MRGEVPLQTSGKQSKGAQPIPTGTPLPASWQEAFPNAGAQHSVAVQCGG